MEVKFKFYRKALMRRKSSIYIKNGKAGIRYNHRDHQHQHYLHHSKWVKGATCLRIPVQIPRIGNRLSANPVNSRNEKLFKSHNADIIPKRNPCSMWRICRWFFSRARRSLMIYGDYRDWYPLSPLETRSTAISALFDRNHDGQNYPSSERAGLDLGKTP